VNRPKPKTEPKPGTNGTRVEFEGSGTLYTPHGAMFLREDRGKVTVHLDGGDMELEISTNYGGGTPLVYCAETDRYFTLSWEDIVSMALRAGVANP